MNINVIAMSILLWTIVIGVIVLVIFGISKTVLHIWEDWGEVISWHDYWRRSYEKKLSEYQEKNKIKDDGGLR